MDICNIMYYAAVELGGKAVERTGIVDRGLWRTVRIGAHRSKWS